MLVVETIAKIRRAYFQQKKAIKTISRELKVSRKAIRKAIRSEGTEFRYERSVQPMPKIGPWREQLDELLLANEGKPRRERLTLVRLFEELRGFGYEGGYDAVRRYARAWAKERGEATAEAFIPLSFFAGRSLPVRLEPRDRPDRRRDVDGEGGAFPALSQPHAVRSRLSAREPGALRALLCLKRSTGAFHPGKPGPRCKGVRCA